MELKYNGGPDYRHDEKDPMKAIGFAPPEGHQCDCGDLDCGIVVSVKNAFGRLFRATTETVLCDDTKMSEDIESVERMLMEDWEVRRLVARSLLKTAGTSVKEYVDKVGGFSGGGGGLGALLGRIGVGG